MKLTYVVTPNTHYANLKELLKIEFLISDRLLLKLKRENKILINGSTASMGMNLNPEDKVEVNIDFTEDNSNITSKQMNLDILYEDEAYLVINKPAGIPVHPSMEHYEDSLSSGIKYYFDKIGLHKKIRPVNRLDKDTSGIVIFAKNEYIQECLIRQMKAKSFKKEYIAVCDGIINQDTRYN